MSNNESFFNSEEQKLEQKLLALIKILKKEGEFNVQNVMRMKYAHHFKNQDLLTRMEISYRRFINHNKQYNYKFTQFTSHTS